MLINIILLFFRDIHSHRVIVNIPQWPEKKKSLYLPYGTVNDGNPG